jgi:hypothetical protein
MAALHRSLAGTPCRLPAAACRGAAAGLSTTLRAAPALRPAAHSTPLLHRGAAELRRQQGSKLLSPLPPPPQHCRRQRAVAPTAGGLYSLPPDLYSSLQTGCGIAYLLGLVFSALPILTGDSRERNERRFLQPDTEESVGGWAAGRAGGQTARVAAAGWLILSQWGPSTIAFASCTVHAPACACRWPANH